MIFLGSSSDVLTSCHVVLIFLDYMGTKAESMVNNDFAMVNNIFKDEIIIDHVMVNNG